MRLKTFQAPSMAAAMNLVRNELGEDAIIVSTNDSGGSGVRITAAVESPEPELDIDTAPDNDKPLEQICSALDRHHTPQDIADRLLNTATLLGTSDLIPTFAGALDLLFDFNPLPKAAPTRPIILFGPPGVGKTSAVAKLAARAVVDHIPVTLITSDTLRAGAVQQLEAYGERLDLPVKTAVEPSDLSKAVSNVAPGQLVLIDTTSANPYAPRDMVRLNAFTDAVEAERLLVMSAGCDADDAREIAAAFREIAPQRLLMTGLDLCRRLGSMLAAVDASHAAFCDVSETPEILEGLRTINPVALARLFLERPQQNGANVGSDIRAHKNEHQATGWK